MRLASYSCQLTVSQDRTRGAARVREERKRVSRERSAPADSGARERVWGVRGAKHSGKERKRGGKPRRPLAGSW